MSRTSKDLDKKLILIGQTLIQEVGVSALSLREVAREADVNLGMLNYYFKGKEDFILQCLNGLYTPFLKELQEINIDSGPEKQFERFLFKLAQFSRDNRKLILILIKDMLSQDPVVTRFIKENFTSHFKLIQTSVIKFLNFEHAPQEKKELAFRLLIANIGLQNLIVGFQEFVQDKPAARDETDTELLKRVHLTMTLLKAIA